MRLMATALFVTNRRKLNERFVRIDDIARDFAGMNEVWDALVPQGCAPARATVQDQADASCGLVSSSFSDTIFE